MKFRLAIFDFDGTLANTQAFFAGIFNEIAQRHRLRQIDPADYQALRHLNVRQMMQHIGLSRWKLPWVTRSFLKAMYLRANEIELFPGIEDLLQSLHRESVSLSIVSSNSERNIRRILGEGNCQLFSQFQCGVSIFGKARRIRSVVRRSRLSSEKAIYIGDQTTDAEAAKGSNVAFGAVSWGFESAETLARAQPDVLFESVESLKQFLLGEGSIN